MKTASPKRSALLESSRRQFLLTATMTTAGVLLPAPLRAAAMQSQSSDGVVVTSKRLDQGWEYRQGLLNDIGDVWHSEEAILWQPVALPHCFNAQDACDPDRGYFRGQGWYRTRLAVTNSFADGRTVLHFQGAGQTTSLWVGSTLIGTHKGGYDEFVFDITQAIARLTPTETKEGVPVVVCCDNSPDLDRVPSELSDFCLYGGLYRHVNLVYLPAVALDAVHVLPTVVSDGTALVSVRARLFNPESHNLSCTVSVEVVDATGKLVHSASHTETCWTGMFELAAFAISAPKLWSPESPSLYRCRVTLATSAGTTSLDERFGIRHTEFVEHGPFKLNGKRVLLRGTQRHADHTGVAAGMSDEMIRKEMTLIRKMGANFIRLAHYQQDRLILELCDELGLMVWEEVPWCRAGVGGEAFQHHAQQMLSNMIDQHYNHPSIILWGLGNEDDWPGEYPSVDEQAIRNLMKQLRDLAHSLDGSRLTSFRRCDFARDIPDVYSPSIWAGWYSGTYREYEQSLLKEHARVKHFMHIEWGADSQAGRHSEEPEAMLRDVATGKGTAEVGLAYQKTGGMARASKDGDWSETYACNLFDWHLKTQEKFDWLTGTAQWAFKDFASPLRGDSSIPRMNQKGVVERDLTIKESYYVFQSYWAEQLMAHIYGHSWPMRWGRPGQLREVKVYSNCERAELFLNGKSLGSKLRASQDFPAAGLLWQVAFNTGKNHLRVVANRGAETVIDEIDFAYQTEQWGKPVLLRLEEKQRKDGVAVVVVTMHDDRGALCLDARNIVRFSVVGEGRLIDNLGTVRGSRELQLSNGSAEISIQQKGGCSVGVASKGLPSALLTLF